MSRLNSITIILYAMFLFPADALCAVDGTMGTPLGGLGTGGIRYSANKGTFFVTETAPCSMDGFRSLPDGEFMLYTNRNDTIQTSGHLQSAAFEGHINDDAIYPVYTANPMGMNGVNLRMTAFSPMSLDSLDLMTLPCGFFEFTIKNVRKTDVEVALAFQISSSTVPTVESHGLYAASDSIERAVFAATDAEEGVVSAGSDSGFFTTGMFDNTPTGTTNAASVKILLPARGSQTVRFVYAWYNNVNPERYYYTNLVQNAKEAATIGLQHFNRLRDNATGFVARMRKSNFPDWIKDHALNSLCNLTTNSIYTKDGRFCFTEGMFDVNGTLDQMWHSRQIMNMLIPTLSWKELEWWARTQKTDPEGQIHHDFGSPMPELWGWDDQQHEEYAFAPNCDDWVDLNCGFIISVYELFVATGDTVKLSYFWPYVKKAAKRILDQVNQYGDPAHEYTFTSSVNTYDQPGLDINYYNASVSLPAYKIMTLLSDHFGDAELSATYQSCLSTLQASFKTRYLSNNFTAGRFTEALLAGQWIGLYLKLGQFHTEADIDYGLSVMDTYYTPLESGIGQPQGSYEEWAPYLISHYAGLSLQTGRLPQWRAMQFDWYERNYENRNRVFNQQLGIPAKVGSPVYMATDSSVFNQYISVPVLWRNYYTILGYYRNKHTGEVWLEPLIPEEMAHVITNGFYMSPEGNGSINVTETGDNFRNQKITITPDSAIPVTTIYLRDRSTDEENVYVTINGTAAPVEKTGEGYARKLKIPYTGTITPAGLSVAVWYANEIDAVKRAPRLFGNTLRDMRFVNVASQFSLPQAWAGEKVRVSLFNVKGELVARKTFNKTTFDITKDFRVSNGFTIVDVSPAR